MRIEELVGNTPVVNLNKVFLKIEYVNPTGSHKDRIAMYMLRDAKEKGLEEGSPVIEYTSGNTGISITWATRFFNYRPVIFLPETIVKEKVNFIKVLGGEVHLVKEDEDGHALAAQLAREEHGLYLAQTRNMANFRAHYETTGPELYSKVESLQCFVMGAGTGGTIYGIGKYLKEKNEKIKVVLLVPRGSDLQEEFFGKKDEDLPILEGFAYHSFSELLKKAFDEDIIDEVKVIDSDMTIEGARALISQGIPGGFTAGANYYYASKIAKEKSCRVATLVADSIVRYSSLMHLIL